MAWYEAKPRHFEAPANDEMLPTRNNDHTWTVRKKPTNRPNANTKPTQDEPQPKPKPQPPPPPPPAAKRLPEKKLHIAAIAKTLVLAPHKNHADLAALATYADRDASPVIQRLATLSLVAVLRDLIPAYRIRLPSAKELTMPVSADVEALRAYERNLLRAYESTIATLRGWARDGSDTDEAAARRLAAARGLCALLEKGRDFNASAALLGALVPLANADDDEVRGMACAGLASLFTADVRGDATLEAVQQMAALIRAASFNVHPQMLECWLHLRVDAGGGPAAAASKRSKKRRRNLDVVSKEMALASGEHGDAGSRHSAVLEQVVVSYARIVKKAPQSPLMPLVLRGLSKYGHQVNIELLLDLLASLRALLSDPDALAPQAALLCAHALLQLLAGPGVALAEDTRGVQRRVYGLLSDRELFAAEPMLLVTALDCVEYLCRHRATLLAARAASFSHRLIDLSVELPQALAIAALASTARLLAAAPRATSILHGDEDGPVRAAPQAAVATDDPDSSRILSTTAWLLAVLGRHYHPTLRRIAALLARNEPLEPELAATPPAKLIHLYSDVGPFNPPMRRPRVAAPSGKRGLKARAALSALGGGELWSGIDQAVRVAQRQRGVSASVTFPWAPRESRD